MVFINGFYRCIVTGKIVHIISYDKLFVSYRYLSDNTKGTMSIDAFEKRFRLDG